MRKIVRWILTVLLGLVILPIITLNVERYAEKHRWDNFLTDHSGAIVAELAEIAREPWFWFLLGVILGATAMAWLLDVLPRETRPGAAPNGSNETEAKALPDPDQLTRAILVYRYDIARKHLMGSTPYIEVNFWVFNGSGFPITIKDEISGLAQLRTPLRDKIELIWRDDHPPTTSRKISYPGHGNIVVRQFLSDGDIQEGKQHAEDPAVRHIDRIFAEDCGVLDRPELVFDFSEVKVLANVVEGEINHDFPIALFKYVEIPYKAGT